jgi:hypothetical protein
MQGSAGGGGVGFVVDGLVAGGFVAGGFVDLGVDGSVVVVGGDVVAVSVAGGGVVLV